MTKVKRSVEPESSQEPPSVLSLLDFTGRMGVVIVDYAVLRESNAMLRAEVAEMHALLRQIAAEDHELTNGSSPKDWYAAWRIVKSVLAFMKEHSIPTCIPSRRPLLSKYQESA